MAEYLTTKELAELLRIKERKVYDLAASGDIPCSRATGKLLFPREAVNAWLASRSSGPAPSAPLALPNVFLGSHDPLLEWALRESQCGIATYFSGSGDGLDRFDAGEGLATGLHLCDAASHEWNTPHVSRRFGARPVVLVEWARRRRGLIVGGNAGGRIADMADLRGRRVAARQAGSGAQDLFVDLLRQSGLGAGDIEFTAPARTEADAALSVMEGKADAAFGLEAVAAQYRLAFVHVIEERFDLLVHRREWFEPPMQIFLDFCRSPAFSSRAGEMAGYDISRFGAVHFNGA